MTMPWKAPTVTILDAGGCLVVCVDWHNGCTPEFGGSYATGRGAQHQEARDLQRAEAERKAEARKAEILAPYRRAGRG